jgi:hypothetical protein
MDSDAEHLRAVLAAYLTVKNASWPDLHPSMSKQSKRWAAASAADLREELAGYMKESAAPGTGVRVFWKLGPKFIFGGCNLHFARDAGLRDPAELLGLDDFSPKLPWQAQAVKYRADDKEVFDGGAAKLDILERQTSSQGKTVFVRVGKAPIKTATGAVIGIFGMYEILDEKAAQKLFFEKSHRNPGNKA